jgi:hypothetical protein
MLFAIGRRGFQKNKASLLCQSFDGGSASLTALLAIRAYSDRLQENLPRNPGSPPDFWRS